ncbi:MAG: hypothetical protein ACJ749_03240, partial [Flavisolibacter sp.]
MFVLLTLFEPRSRQDAKFRKEERRDAHFMIVMIDAGFKNLKTIKSQFITNHSHQRYQRSVAVFLCETSRPGVFAFQKKDERSESIVILHFNDLRCNAHRD